MRSIFLVLFGLLSIVLVSVLIETYFFSWTGFLLSKVGACECKTVRVPAENAGVENPGFYFDTSTIAAEMRKKSDYNVKETSRSHLVLKRKFGKVNYGIFFYGQQTDKPGFKFFTGLGDLSDPSPEGETCTTPNRILRQNIYAIIDDLPLSEEQKNEMKSYVQVRYSSTFRFS